MNNGTVAVCRALLERYINSAEDLHRICCFSKDFLCIFQP